MDDKCTKADQGSRDQRVEQKTYSRYKRYGDAYYGNKKCEDMNKANSVKSTLPVSHERNTKSPNINNKQIRSGVTTEHDKPVSRRNNDRRTYPTKENYKPPRTSNYSRNYRPRKSNNYKNGESNITTHYQQAGHKSTQDFTTASTQSIKPAIVHVQPIIQNEENILGITNTDDSSSNLQHLLHAKTEKEIERPEQSKAMLTSGEKRQVILNNDPLQSKTNEPTTVSAAVVPCTEVLRSTASRQPCFSTGFQNKTTPTSRTNASKVKLNTTGKEHSIQLESENQKDSMKISSNIQDQEKTVGDKREYPLNAVPLSKDSKPSNQKIEHDKPQVIDDCINDSNIPLSAAKYGYRISVDSLFSTSFFDTTQKQEEDSDFVNPQEKSSELQTSSSEVSTVTTSSNCDTAAGIRANYLPIDNNSFSRPSLIIPITSNDPGENYDARIISPKRSSEKLRESSAEVKQRNTLSSFNAQEHVNISYKSLQTNEEPFPSAISDLSVFPSNDDATTDILQDNKDISPQQDIISQKTSKNIKSSRTLDYNDIVKCTSNLHIFPDHIKKPVQTQYDTITNAKYQENDQQKKDKTKKDEEDALTAENRDTRVHQGTFPQGPFISSPFFSHPLLTHRHAIPSAFVYPSRIGLPGNPSSFTHDVTQHSNNNQSAHLFPGATVFLNVGGRLFEVLPSTFGAYPESLLYQIFAGSSTPQINQRGQIFFDRDGYLFEIILAFARLGQLTLPPRVSLTALIQEAKYFGMYDYMFQQGKVPSTIPFHFQRTTCCTLGFDHVRSEKETKIFILDGEDKLKIESLKANGHCSLFVDLYTPSGIKETSKFLLYSPEKPDLWKAYQFCAERKLVFYVDSQGNQSSDNENIYIVFAQTFVFNGDEFIP